MALLDLPSLLGSAEGGDKGGEQSDVWRGPLPAAPGVGRWGRVGAAPARLLGSRRRQLSLLWPTKQLLVAAAWQNSSKVRGCIFASL
jgi:hypothetical protein